MIEAFSILTRRLSREGRIQAARAKANLYYYLDLRLPPRFARRPLSSDIHHTAYYHLVMELKACVSVVPKFLRRYAIRRVRIQSKSGSKSAIETA